MLNEHFFSIIYKILIYKGSLLCKKSRMPHQKASFTTNKEEIKILEFTDDELKNKTEPKFEFTPNFKCQSLIQFAK